MRISLSIFSFSVIILLVFQILAQSNALGEAKKTPKGVPSKGPIVIHSDSMEFDQQKRLIIFKGKVKARRKDMVVDCQKMIIYYLENPKEKESAMEAGRVDKIVALGDVVINRPDGSVARAGKAVFYQTEGKVVLTENPFLQQGQDSVEGQRIIMFLNENRSIVEGGEKKRVKATIFPKEEKGR